MPNFSIKIKSETDFNKVLDLTPLETICALFTNKEKTPML